MPSVVWMQSLYNVYIFYAALASGFKQWEPQGVGEAKGNAAITISLSLHKKWFTVRTTHLWDSKSLPTVDKR